MWSGIALVSGLSDTHSERWARMRLLLRPSEVLGAIVADDSAPVVAVRRLLLLGCTVELDGEDSIVSGPAAISRPVVFKPCGAAPVRAAFHAALLAARGALPPPCLALVTTTSSVPQPTPCLLSFAANKHRAVLVVQPVVALGLEGGEPPAGGAGEGGDAGENAAPAPPLVRVALPAAKAPATLYLKVGKSCRLQGVGADHATGAMEVAPVRTIFRVSALLGLITYKAQGKAQRLRARAVDLGDAAHVELLFNGLGAAGAPLPAAPLASHEELRSQLVALRELLARPRSAALPALTPAPLQLLAGAVAGAHEGSGDGGGGGGGGGGGDSGGYGDDATSGVELAKGADDMDGGAAAAAGEASEMPEEEKGDDEEEEEEEEGEEHTEAWSEGAGPRA